MLARQIKGLVKPSMLVGNNEHLILCYNLFNASTSSNQPSTLKSGSSEVTIPGYSGRGTPCCRAQPGNDTSNRRFHKKLEGEMNKQNSDFWINVFIHIIAKLRTSIWSDMPCLYGSGGLLLPLPLLRLPHV